MDDPFAFFARICCVRLDPGSHHWDAIRTRLDRLGLAARVRQVLPDARLVEPRVVVAMTHRDALCQAFDEQADTVLVLEDHCLLLSDAPLHLGPVVADLAGLDWTMLYLGGAAWGRPMEALPGRGSLRQGAFTGTHAIAYSRAGMERVLADMPAAAPRMADWIDPQGSLDRYLATLPGRLLARPSIASLPNLLPYEDPALRDRFLV